MSVLPVHHCGLSSDVRDMLLYSYLLEYVNPNLIPQPDAWNTNKLY